ncbi:MAG TPA: chromosome segregation SMC family protein, partial [Thermohalobaculum sp.]|nr:chromosome segregation SMC family protein [Thermohalobaculum sp.]
MHFTRLRLQGFKSFVDPAELVISTGLTGVVGPNGCGKSNLLEALRWVMGENRARAMRGEGMDDVIFAGTDRRPARGSASVELVLDNSDRLAPAAFNGDDRLEISRRITRDIGSAYSVNGKTVRARDVAMLFADASTGAHSPALVRQGEVAELIRAKPKARRRILEEAAGISGLYQRRHEAELKLNAAEANLARVDDVLEQLGTRLRSLDRQAAQARRYREIGEALRRAEATLLAVRWRLAEEERVAAERALSDGTRAAAEAERAALAAARGREEAESALPPLREEESIAAAVHQRLTVERDRLAEEETRARAEIERLAARARQLARDTEREETLANDAGGSIARLDEEEAELRAAHEGHDAVLAEAQEAARAAREDLAAREAALDRLTEEAARLAARAAAAERRVDEAGKTARRIADEIARAEAAEAALASGIEDARNRLTAAAAEAETAHADAAAAEAALEAAEAERAEAQNAEASARARASETEGERAALAAEVEALERLLKRDADGASQIIDGIEVGEGMEAALGAALGDDLRAPALGHADDGTGWIAVEPYAAEAALPEGAEPLVAHVGGPLRLQRRLARVGLVAREAGDRLQASLGPGTRLVSREGDLWRWDGYRLRAEDAPSATAVRLQQQNRLKALSAGLETARRAGAVAAETHGEARARLDRAGIAESAARKARREADARQTETTRAEARAEADLEMQAARLENQRLQLAARGEERDAAAAAMAEAEKAVAEVGDVAAARQAVEAERRAVEAARGAMLAARGRADEIRRAGEARESRLAAIERERRGWRERSESAGGRLAELARRSKATAVEHTRAAGVPDEIAEKRGRLARELEMAENRRRAAGDALAAGENARRTAAAAAQEAERAAS